MVHLIVIIVVKGPDDYGEERLNCIGKQFRTQVHKDIPSLREMRPESFEHDQTHPGTTTHCAFDAQMEVWRHEPREVLTN